LGRPRSSLSAPSPPLAFPEGSVRQSAEPAARLYSTKESAELPYLVSAEDEASGMRGCSTTRCRSISPMPPLRALLSRALMGCPPENSGSQVTRRWRERDSNPRSPSGTSRSLSHKNVTATAPNVVFMGLADVGREDTCLRVRSTLPWRERDSNSRSRAGGLFRREPDRSPICQPFPKWSSNTPPLLPVGPPLGPRIDGPTPRRSPRRSTLLHSASTRSSRLGGS